MGQNEIGFSVNGFRRELSRDIKELKELTESYLETDELDKDDLTEAVNNLICKSNGFNCVKIEAMDSFSNMSDLEVSLIDN